MSNPRQQTSQVSLPPDSAGSNPQHRPRNKAAFIAGLVRLIQASPDAEALKASLEQSVKENQRVGAETAAQYRLQGNVDVLEPMRDASNATKEFSLMYDLRLLRGKSDPTCNPNTNRKIQENTRKVVSELVVSRRIFWKDQSEAQSNLQTDTIQCPPASQKKHRQCQKPRRNQSNLIGGQFQHRMEQKVIRKQLWKNGTSWRGARILRRHGTTRKRTTTRKTTILVPTSLCRRRYNPNSKSPRVQPRFAMDDLHALQSRRWTQIVAEGQPTPWTTSSS